MVPERLPILINLALDDLRAGHLDFAEATLHLILENTKQVNHLAAQGLLSLNHDHCHDCTEFLQQIAQATSDDT